jgi:hypothetical protein
MLLVYEHSTTGVNNHDPCNNEVAVAVAVGVVDAVEE